jgi:hypothetical protein
MLIHVILPQPLPICAAGFVLEAQYAHCPTSTGVVLVAAVVELGGTVVVGADVVVGAEVGLVVDSEGVAETDEVLDTSTGYQYVVCHSPLSYGVEEAAGCVTVTVSGVATSVTDTNCGVICGAGVSVIVVGVDVVIVNNIVETFV